MGIATRPSDYGLVSAPSLTNAMAKPRPRPEAAPVMTAVLPWRLMWCKERAKEEWRDPTYSQRSLPHFCGGIWATFKRDKISIYVLLVEFDALWDGRHMSSH
jgi:hypothetical protein